MIALLFMLLILGVILWLIETHLPLSPPIKTLIRVIIVLAVIYYLWTLLGAPDLPLPRAG